MAKLKIVHPPKEVGMERVVLIATFIDLLDALDRGNLARAAAMQESMAQRGVCVTCRPSYQGRGIGRAL